MKVQVKNLYNCEYYLARAFQMKEDCPNKMTLVNNMRNVVVWKQVTCPHCGKTMMLSDWPIELVPMFSVDFLIRELRHYVGLDIPITVMEKYEDLPMIQMTESGEAHCGCLNARIPSEET